MKTKIIIIVALILGLTACGNSDSGKKEKTVDENTSEQPFAVQTKAEEDKPYRKLLLQFTGLDENFEVIIAFTDDEMKSGYAMYNGKPNAFLLSSITRKRRRIARKAALPFAICTTTK